MERRANVESLDLLDEFRRALIRFAEEAGPALGAAEAEAQRTLSWLGGEQSAYWRGQVRRREQQVARAKEEVRKKSLYQNVDGSRPSAVEEKKALALAERGLEEAQHKAQAVRRWRRRLEREVHQYKAQSQAIARAVESDVPRAVALLDRMGRALDQYVAQQAPPREAQPTGDEASMARPPAEHKDDLDDQTDSGNV